MGNACLESKPLQKPGMRGNVVLAQVL